VGEDGGVDEGDEAVERGIRGDGVRAKGAGTSARRGHTPEGDGASRGAQHGAKRTVPTFRLHEGPIH